MEKIRLKRAIWEYDLSKPLGPEGGFGTVYAGSSENGEQVAVPGRTNISNTTVFGVRTTLGLQNDD